MGVCTILFSGDFCQNFSIVMRVTRGNEVNTPLKRPYLRPFLNRLELKSNKRILFLNCMGFGQISQDKIRIILHNANHVGKLNDLMISKANETTKIYYSVGTSLYLEDAAHFQTDSVNCWLPSELPRHKLALKVGCPII